MHLTQVKKKGRALGDKVIDEVRDLVDEYSNVYLFQVQNMRNAVFKKLRALWSTSRFFIGRNKLLSVALGRSEDSEYRPGLSALATRLRGERGLLFTNKDAKAVKRYFSEFKEPQFARAGCEAPRRYTIPPMELTGRPVSMEPQLRRLGLPVRVKKGKIVLIQETVVCDKGDTLTAEQCKILELFGEKMVDFRVEVLGYYSDEKYSEL